MSQDYQKDKIYQNLTTESGPKQRFCLLQEKLVIQAVRLRTPGFRPKRKASWVFRKSQKISTASD